MKKLIVLFLLASSFIYSQNFELGGGFIYGFGSSKIEAGPGAQIIFSYKVMKNIRLRSNIMMYFSEFKGIEPNIGKDNYSLFSTEISALYYPLRWDIEPFLGAGVGYYDPYHNQPGMLTTQFPVNKNLDENHFGVNISGGLKFSPDEVLSLQTELKYIFLEEKLTSTSDEFRIDEDINLNVLFFGLSLLYNF